MACQLPHSGQMTGEDIEDFFFECFRSDNEIQRMKMVRQKFIQLAGVSQSVMILAPSLSFSNRQTVPSSLRNYSKIDVAKE